MTWTSRALTLPVAVLVVALLTSCSAHADTDTRHPSGTAPVARTPMPEARFWEVIAAARGTTDDTARAARPSALRTQLERLSDHDVEAFDLRYGQELAALDRWSVWDAGYAAAGGMTDDDFEYFRSWLVGKGQSAVHQVETDPDGLVRLLGPADAAKDGFDDEELEYVADDVLAERIGSDRADAFDDHALAADGDDPTGTESAESTIDLRYPQLAAWARAHPSD
ncbi:DUF4240 domain-containing protein [Curtobacterium sp. MCBA15_001]|uniref:DUF4240 domain-containing protein n=1 Tax=Curtobacterium sp. MCBA15_001 TaxID=1898731 RepID=UPI0008DCED40|nr:DUF4240 domain-containing protein [Curtobacterium sp. MCBA15_001]OIH95620.1 hypothetical protein BIU90_02760 [Curtobacterium sp. MCBA15_001]